MSSESREVLHDVDAHPVHGTRTYWIIGVWLFVLTALEIGAYFMEESLGEFATLTILSLSAAKYILVVMFFMLTGFHGAHVFVGVLYMITLATLVWTGRIKADKSLNVEIGGLYWHFVDVVWIVIFPLIYLIP